MARCPWCGDDAVYTAYHDTEWGVPLHDERMLFEFLILEGAQAGLSWITILKKREAYRRAFDNFDAERIARYTPKDVARLMNDAGIVRNRLKIDAAIGNARALLALWEQDGSLDALLWGFVDGQPLQNHWRSMTDVPVTTPTSDAMAKALKKRGFRFVGSTICYSLMQAVGLVNDHLADCPRHDEIARAAMSRPASSAGNGRA